MCRSCFGPTFNIAKRLSLDYLTCSLSFAHIISQSVARLITKSAVVVNQATVLQSAKVVWFVCPVSKKGRKKKSISTIQCSHILDFMSFVVFYNKTVWCLYNFLQATLIGTHNHMSIMKLVYKRSNFLWDNNSHCLTEYRAGLFGRSPISTLPPQPGPSCLSTISDWFLTLSKTACQVLSVKWSNETKNHFNFIPLILIETLLCWSFNAYQFLVGFDPC